MDNNTLTNPGKIGSRGLVRNFKVCFQFVFYGRVSLSNILHAEMYVLMIEIKLWWEAGYKKLVCFSDTHHVAHLVSKEMSKLHHYANLLELITVYLVKE